MYQSFEHRYTVRFDIDVSKFQHQNVYISTLTIYEFRHRRIEATAWNSVFAIRALYYPFRHCIVNKWTSNFVSSTFSYAVLVIYNIVRKRNAIWVSDSEPRRSSIQFQPAKCALYELKALSLPSTSCALLPYTLLKGLCHLVSVRIRSLGEHAQKREMNKLKFQMRVIQHRVILVFRFKERALEIMFWWPFGDLVLLKPLTAMAESMEEEVASITCSNILPAATSTATIATIEVSFAQR